MTRKSVIGLGALVAGLLLAALALQTPNQSNSSAAGQLLLPDLASVANAATQVIVTTGDASGQVTLRQQDGQWFVVERGNYPADFGKLSTAIVAIASARVTEEKTSNADHYEKLGVADPDDGGNGRKLTISGDHFSHAIILGELAQGTQRYVRLAEEPTSYLIDQNPEIPDSVGEWLVADIVDLETDRVRRVSITHPDGEMIVLEKTSQEQTDFTVLEIPQDRELSYATIANGTAGALSKLTLTDVRTDADAEPSTTTTFDTWDGLTVTAEIHAADEHSWVAFSAHAQEIGQSSADDSEDASPAPNLTAVSEEATAINNRLKEWQYQLVDSKTDLLVRRWDDILKAAE